MDCTWDRILLHPTKASVPRLAVSSCLLGNPVRFDGSDRKAETVATALAYHCELLPVCPEVEMELGVPRETIRIEEGQDGERRLIGNESGEDFTPRLQPVLSQRLQEFRELGMSGFVFKARSPSCAPGDYPYCDAEGKAEATGFGLFAAAVRDHFPLLPMTDEESLLTAKIRRPFLLRVFTHFRLRKLFHDGPQVEALMAFHAAAEPLRACLGDSSWQRLEEVRTDPRAYCHKLLGALRECEPGSEAEEAIRFLRKEPPSGLTV